MGSGYPDRLMGKEIPYFARIVAVADVYDALTSERSYRKAWTHDEALNYLIENKGIHFDPICVLRVVLGLTFLIHGVVKFQDGIQNTVGWFESIGLPGFLAYGVATVEVVGGIFLIIGLGNRIVSGLLGVVMLGAIFKAKLSLGFLGNGQMAGYELDIALLAMAVVIAITGSKLFAVDHLIKGNKEQSQMEKAA